MDSTAGVAFVTVVRGSWKDVYRSLVRGVIIIAPNDFPCDVIVIIVVIVVICVLCMPEEVAFVFIIIAVTIVIIIVIIIVVVVVVNIVIVVSIDDVVEENVAEDVKAVDDDTSQTANEVLPRGAL